MCKLGLPTNVKVYFIYVAKFTILFPCFTGCGQVCYICLISNVQVGFTGCCLGLLLAIYFIILEVLGLLKKLHECLRNSLFEMLSLGMD